MPVDIRSFFQTKKPAKDSSQKGKASGENSTRAATSKTTTSASVANLKSNKNNTSNGSSSNKTKRKRQVAPERSHTKKNDDDDKGIVEINDSASEEEEILVKSNEPEKKRKMPDSRKSASPSTLSSKKSPVKTASSPAKRKRIVIESDDDYDEQEEEEDDDDEEYKLQGDSDENSDNDDIVEILDERPASRSSLKVKPVSQPTKEISTSTYFARSTASSPTKKAKPSPQPVPVKKPLPSPKKTTKKKQEAKILAPDDCLPLDYFPSNQAAPECLQGYTFCLTAVDSDWGREDATDFLKALGARVTTAVSGKTDYLFVMGELLEDDRPYTEGSKYKKATQLGKRVLVGRPALNAVTKFHSDQVKGESAMVAPHVSGPKDPPKTTSADLSKVRAPASAATTEAASLSTSTISNPYARKAPVNPYARKTKANEIKPPIVASSLSTTRATTTELSTQTRIQSVVSGPHNAPMLWVDKYKPQETQDILGNAESVRKLRKWLNEWESIFNKDNVVGKSFSNPKGPWKAVLLSGPPGIGKTTTATLVAKESGRHLVEFNASDVRSKRSLKEDIGDITGSRTLRLGQAGEALKRVIVMDEVDGLGAGDRGGLSEMIQMIKHTRVPIICICNDRQSQKIRSLVPYCMDLKYSRPRKTQIAARAVQIAAQEGLAVEQNAAELLAESCGGDVRQVLNSMQMWASEHGGRSRMSYTGLKERENSINKDEMLRVSLFDATRLVVQGRAGLQGASPEVERAHFMKRNDAFFVDYNFTGLMVQQNYVSVLKGPYGKAAAARNTSEIENVLERMSRASESMSDFALAEQKLRSDQNWSVLPFVGSLTVKTGFHAGGETGGFLPGFPEFTAWLGKNSSKGKKERMMQDLQHHMNFRISGGSQEMRLSYLPVLRERFLFLLKSKDDSATDEVIHLMDAYGLDRDDILEKFDEFKMDQKDKGFSSLDSKQKAALTRAYNATSHKSQALVAAQGEAKKSKRQSAGSEEMLDPDAIDDDKQSEEGDNNDDELDSSAVAAMFKKKGRKAAPATGAKKPAPKRKKK